MKKKRKLYNKTILKWIYLFLLGTIGFSKLGIELMIVTLHFPFYFIEWIYIPFILKYGKRTFNKLGKVNLFEVLLLLLLIFSVIMGVFDSKSAIFLTEYRSILYLIIVFKYVKVEGLDDHFEDFLFLCLFSSISELVYVAVFTTRNVVSSTNCLACAIAILGFFIIEKYKTGLIAFLISMLTGILSGYRIGILTPGFSLIIAFLYNLTHGNENGTRIKRLRKIVYLCIIFSLTVGFIRNYEAIIIFLANKLNMDRFAVFRVTTRMKAIFSFDFTTSQDSGRIGDIILPFTEFTKSIIPRGLIRANGYYIDTPILVLYDTVGSITAWLIVGYFLAAFIKAFSKKKRYRKVLDQSHSELLDFSLCISPIILFLFIVNGSFIKILYQSIQTGIVLGLLMFTAKLNRMDRTI